MHSPVHFLCHPDDGLGGGYAQNHATDDGLGGGYAQNHATVTEKLEDKSWLRMHPFPTPSSNVPAYSAAVFHP
ncbi:hypothetical protein C5167_009377 [Papaver somniferum]|uniref:Uncharacterized protein n=1 Tax=Papaver somniferum TaxID=3469 RepID=A0A4Y7K056_PAPSO|nr:hypothetical protein C5167_009377 [Papaver somniferum]